jgi:hypothetical protein
MSDLSLPVLDPDDPENLLSRKARQRIRAAYMASHLIRAQALSRLETLYNAEPSRGIGFAEFLSSGSAYNDMTESMKQAARKVLSVQAAEFRKLGLPASEFQKIMQGNIEHAVYALELSKLQNEELDLEFLCATDEQDQHVDDELRSAENEGKNASAADRVKDFMQRKGLTNLAFAKLIGMSERTVGYVLAGDPIGKGTRVAVANALGITSEELFRE